MPIKPIKFINLHWNTYTFNKPKINYGFTIKSLYGLLGIVILLYLSLSSPSQNNMSLEPNLPPSIWYFSWIYFSEANDSTNNNNVSIKDERPIKTREENIISIDSNLLWGTDVNCKDIYYHISNGASSYVTYGIIAVSIGISFGLLWAFLIEFPKRNNIPLPHKINRWNKGFISINEMILNTIDFFPKFLLLLSIYAIGGLDDIKFALSIGIFLTFNCITVFRNEIKYFLGSEQYIYALEMGISPTRIVLIHIGKRILLPAIYVQIPFMLSSYILYESTITFMGFGINIYSWGILLKDNYLSFNHAFWITSFCIILVISSLYMLGDALRSKHSRIKD